MRDSAVVGLFDLSTDPEERVDLVGQYPERAEALKGKPLAWRADPCGKGRP